MAKKYVVTSVTRDVNRVTSFFARRGWGRLQLLTTTGRSSGESREVPVAPIEVGGVEYLVAPYGSVSWVKNVRANPQVQMRKGKTVRSCVLHEVTGDAAEVLEAYWDKEPFTHQYMDVPESPSVEDFAASGDAFPVFRVDAG